LKTIELKTEKEYIIKDTYEERNNKTLGTIEQEQYNFLFKFYTSMSLIITQYLNEIDTLFTILENAKVGQLHPYLIGPQELLDQFQDIRLSLPEDRDLPYIPTLDTVYDILKLSDIVVYYSNDNLVFVITIHLVHKDNFILYNLIPKPICKKNMNCMYVKPSYNFIAISKTKERYTTYNNSHYAKCKYARDFLLCPEIQTLHPRNLRPICEVQLLQEPREVPNNYEIRQFQLRTSIFHKLKYQNKWLYATTSKNIIINCEDDKESSTHILEGVGIITLNEI
jgi:hypothetical protein